MHFNSTHESAFGPPAFFRKLASTGCLRGLFLLALAAGLAWPMGIRAQSASQREYEIKAAYLYNFINYVDWPAGTLPPSGGTLTIGIVGENPFGLAMDPLSGKSIKGHTLAVKQVATANELAQCQIVFICASEKLRLSEIFEQLKESKVLTVSETEGFASRGGIINFFSDRNKVRFEINADAARRTGLTISSELLKLAKLVKS
jgi:hypothetical protein